MKKIFFYSNLIFLFFCLNFSLSYASIQNKIIAEVENEIISSYELKNKIITSLILNNRTINQENIDGAKNQALRALINYKLKKNEIKKFNISKQQNNFNLYLQNTAKQYNTDIQGFKKIFSNNNLDYSLYEEEIKTELAWQGLIVGLYGEKTNINEKEVDEELKQLIKKQKNIFEYKLSEIEIQVENNKQIDDLIKEVQNQINLVGFNNTAIKYSISLTAVDGGDLGWINSKSLSNRILKILDKMELGDVSEPITQTNTILFIKLENKKKLDLDKVNFEEIRKKIILQKKNELLDLYSNSHLSKIRNNAYINLK